ncbi:MAG: hypothetical protein JSR30_07930, partial [Proteobacteria bacterium]|nr:hypothetical protein [Pseudomonadota bacterium]
MPGWLVWLSGKPVYATRTRQLADKLALSDAAQLGQHFLDHFALMGCDPHPLLSDAEKVQMVARLSTDTDFLARANLDARDLRCILDWTHHAC